MTNTPDPASPAPTRPLPDLPNEPQPMPMPGDPVPEGVVVPAIGASAK